MDNPENRTLPMDSHSISENSREELSDQVIALIKEAGREVMSVYREEDAGITQKADNTPLTRADTAANEVICRGLQHIHERRDEAVLPVLSEENREIPHAERQAWDHFWLVDPLDGTKEFINRNGEFTVNIALISRHRPVIGVIHAPVLELTYVGIQDQGTYCQHGNDTWQKLADTGDEDDDDGKIEVVASRSHLNEETRQFTRALEEHFTVTFSSAGSSLKFCLLAEGKAQIYPRLAPTMEWDTGAAQAILEANAGRVVTYENWTPLTYNKNNLTNPSFIATSRAGTKVLQKIGLMI